MDDLVVKSRDRASLIDDLEEMFNSLHRTHMKLNPEKCMFGILTRKLLEFLVSNWGIEANPDKIWAIEGMHPPSRLKDVQCLTNCMAALSRFILWLGEKGMPLFKLIKKADLFEWSLKAK